jgi:ATP-dependent RNA helicase DeaD
MFSSESPLPATSSDAESQAEPETAPEAEVPHSSTTFDQLKLIVPLMQAVKLAGYKSCTPVQAAVIPPAMLGKDVIGQAQTGTGKTCAFLMPFMNRWRPHKTKGPIGLVMAPTRELALQVAREAEKLAPSRHFRTVAVYGGTGMQKQLDALAKGCDLVVGTPGRMLDHLSRGTLNLSNVRYVVLDEADRMLDIGFRPDIERILRRCPEKRQTLLMSATVPDEIKKLTHKYMTDPLHLNLSPKVLTVDKIRQTYITVEKEKKFDLLLKWLQREQPKQAIIFVERKRSADKLHRLLRPYVAGAAAIHGDLPQTQREKIMAGFRSGKVTCLIATDVASRGIDVSGISHVINYDLPMDIENYVHRIGRTGRIGKLGVAVSFVLPEEGGHLTDIEMTINKLIEPDRIEGFDAVTPKVRRSVDDPEPAAAQPEVNAAPKQAIFGKRVKKYSERL